MEPTIVDTVIATAQAWWPVVTGVVTVAAAVSTITPTKVDDRIVQLILDIINKLGLNVGKAKNADDK